MKKKVSVKKKVSGTFLQRKKVPDTFLLPRKLTQLHVAGRVEDLRIPPNNRLEALKGDRKVQWSIRVNDQWRVCFRFEKDAAFDVEIVDYH